jgi:hypothetical protein
MRPPLDLAIFAEEPAAAPAAGPPVQSGASPVNEDFPGSRFDPGSEEQALARVPGIPGLPGSISQDRLRVEPEPGAVGGAAEHQFRAAGPGLKPADRRTLAALAGVRGFDQGETRAMLEACQAGAELATGERIGAAGALACWQAIAAEHAEAIAARLEVEQAERARRRCDSCRHLRRWGCANRQAAGLPAAWGASNLVGKLPPDRGASCAAWSAWGA